MNQAPFTFAVMIAMSVGLLHAPYTAHTFYHPQTELLGTQPFRQLDEVSSAHKRCHVSLERVYFKTNDEQVLGNYFDTKTKPTVSAISLVLIPIAQQHSFLNKSFMILLMQILLPIRRSILWKEHLPFVHQ